MKIYSLRLRLLLTAAALIGVTLSLAGAGLVLSFRSHIIDRTKLDLKHHLNQLAAVFTLDADGKPVLDAHLTDPRFDGPLSGLYWQIMQDGKPVLRSRSLWDEQIRLDFNGSSLPAGVTPRATGPGNVDLIAVSRPVTFRSPKQSAKRQHYRLVVALDRTEIEKSSSDLAHKLILGLSLLAAALIAVIWLQVTIGLRPLLFLTDRLAGVRRGEEEKLDGHFPSEVVPLVEELNDLLAGQRKTVLKARARAADLAHGLKTPLTAISANSEILKSRGEAKIASAIDSHVGTMHRHVERELALARSQGSKSGTPSVVSVRAAIEKTTDVLRRLPGGDELHWDIDAGSGLTAAMDGEDFDEVIGNILDNARKWARSQVTIKAIKCAEGIKISISDDGPGVPEEMVSSMLERGFRLDEKTQGSGIGLSIVQAILEDYDIDLQILTGKGSDMILQFVLPAPDVT